MNVFPGCLWKQYLMNTKMCVWHVSLKITYSFFLIIDSRIEQFAEMCFFSVWFNLSFLETHAQTQSNQAYLRASMQLPHLRCRWMKWQMAQCDPTLAGCSCRPAHIQLWPESTIGTSRLYAWMWTIMIIIIISCLLPLQKFYHELYMNELDKTHHDE